jgi:hypothetical protein
MDEELIKLYRSVRHPSGITVNDIQSAKEFVYPDNSPDHIIEMMDTDAKYHLLQKLLELTHEFPNDTYHVKFKRQKLDPQWYGPQTTLNRVKHTMLILSGTRFKALPDNGEPIKYHTGD